MVKNIICSLIIAFKFIFVYRSFNNYLTYRS